MNKETDMDEAEARLERNPQTKAMLLRAEANIDNAVELTLEDILKPLQ
jgi:hypothetical protein